VSGREPAGSDGSSGVPARAIEPSLDRALDRELEKLGAGALVILSGAGGSEPDLARHTGAAKLGESFVVHAKGDPPRLGYFTPMERDEAAATGLRLLEPERLDVAKRAKDHATAGGYLAAVIAEALRQSGVAPGVVAVAGGWPAGALVEAVGALAEEGYRLVSGTEAARRLRKSKRAAELDEIRRVARVTVDAFRAVAARLATATVRDGELWSAGERLTVAHLKREIALLFAAHELTQPRTNIVAPGEEAGVPHTAGTAERALRDREAVIVDLFPKGLLYADCTRTLCAGPPPEPVLRAHADVLAALELAQARARAGTRGFEVQQAICDLFAARGWPTPLDTPGTLRGYVHNLGHGVGYELHELPSFKQTASEEESVLEVGDVITLEPGLYEPGPGGWGVRLEDLLVVTADGLDNLTPLPYALDPKAWAS
jgi:Xaa-Pro aminopeptidase